MSSLLSISTVFTYILYIIIALAVLLFLVMVHEFGHYVAGRVLGFKIEEFSIGFGPKIFQKKKKNGELFSLRAVPLGGYCAFDGEDLDSKSPTAFNNQKPWKRLIVLVSGVLFNFISAVIFSFILLVGFGYEKVEVKQVNPVTTIEGSVLQKGDVIYGINNIELDFVKDNYYQALIHDYIESPEFENDNKFISDGETYSTIPFNVENNNQKRLVNVIVKQVVDGEDVSWTFKNKYNGEDFELMQHKTSVGDALGECWTFSFRWSYKILIILGDLITGQIPINDLGGPVTTIKVMADTTSQNFAFIFVLIPVIAINLAVFNILPIPSLDGARCIFVLIEWIRKKPINRDVEARIHGIGLMVLLGFVVLVDILHFIL